MNIPAHLPSRASHAGRRRQISEMLVFASVVAFVLVEAVTVSGLIGSKDLAIAFAIFAFIPGLVVMTLRGRVGRFGVGSHMLLLLASGVIALIAHALAFFSVEVLNQTGPLLFLALVAVWIWSQLVDASCGPASLGFAIFASDCAGSIGESLGSGMLAWSRLIAGGRAPASLLAWERRHLLETQQRLDFPGSWQSISATNEAAPTWTAEQAADHETSSASTRRYSSSSKDRPAKVREEEPKPVRDLAEVRAEVDALIGLSDFKGRFARDLAYQHAEQIKREADPEYGGRSRRLHSILEGGPGTGKSMCARLLADAWSALGLSNGHYEGSSASKLLGQNIGAARERTRALLERNAGGVVFLDEFGAVLHAAGDTADVGQEVVEELLDWMENNPACPTVIIADYPQRIDAALAKNDGFGSRFRVRYAFPSYTAAELAEIARLNITKDRHHLTPDADLELRNALTTLYDRYRKLPIWSSARVAVTLWEKILEEQSQRVSEQMPSAGDPHLIEEADVVDGLRSFLAGNPFRLKSQRA